MSEHSKHPSKDIIASDSKSLLGKKIVLCITGSVAAHLCPELSRRLMRNGAEVYVVMSPSATKILHESLMEWATGNSAITELTGRLEHVELAGVSESRCDLVLVAPSTANTVSKIACGIDDTTVTTIVSMALGSEIPVMVAPAMHGPLYDNPFVVENLKRLQEKGVEIIEPYLEEGKAKIADVDIIVERVIARLSPVREMTGLRVLVTAGPTVEYIDPVRVITNRSSGKMGVAIAKEALRRGADVTLVYGEGLVSFPSKLRTLKVDTSKAMLDAVEKELKERKFDIAFLAAAVGDFTPLQTYTYKFPSRGVEKITVDLVPTAKIIPRIKQITPNCMVIGFRAEYKLEESRIQELSKEYLEAFNADMVAINDVSRTDIGFMSDANELWVVDSQKNMRHIPKHSKDVVAATLIDLVMDRLKSQGNRTS